MVEFENVIIIPYRNRKEHLELFIKNVIPLFEKYLKPFKLVIVEQDEGKLFNRGMLLNIGFNEYKDKSRFFFTHDVDTLPNDICVKKIYTKNDYDVIRISIPHNLSLGNICKFTSLEEGVVLAFRRHQSWSEMPLFLHSVYLRLVSLEHPTGLRPTFGTRWI